jgi:hypothetical protein
MTVFWEVAPWSLGKVYRRFRGAYCRRHRGHLLIARMIEAARASVTSVYIYQTTRRNIPEDIFLILALRTLNFTSSKHILANYLSNIHVMRFIFLTCPCVFLRCSVDILSLYFFLHMQAPFSTHPYSSPVKDVLTTRCSLPITSSWLRTVV